MLTFPLRYNFPVLRMRTTSWIVKKNSAYAEKIARKKVELQATCFCPPRAFSYKSFDFRPMTLKKLNKQTKLRWWEVDHSLMAILSVRKTV